MPMQGGDNACARNVPDFGGLIMTAGDENFVIRRERNRGHVAAVPLKRSPLVALAARLLWTLFNPCPQELLDIPNFGDMIHRGSCEGPAIRRKGDSADSVADVRPAGAHLVTG